MPNPGQGIRLRASARTNKGRVRENNEDRVHLWSPDEQQLMLAIVADGMGGAAAGEEASRIAIETIEAGMNDGPSHTPEDYSKLDEDDLADKLRTIVREANINIIEKAQSTPALKGMGTTITLVYARDNRAVIAHVGDSRAYFVDGHDGDITQITSDHSFVQALIDAGYITRDEADEHPMRNVLYRALGQADEIDVDVYYNVLQTNDRLVLCSDGLTLHVKSDEIARLVIESETPEDASEKLLNLALERGGKDNISVIVIKAEGENGDEAEVIAEEEPIVENESMRHDGEDDTLILFDRDRHLNLDFDIDEDTPTVKGADKFKDSEMFLESLDYEYSETDVEGSDPFRFDQ